MPEDCHTAHLVCGLPLARRLLATKGEARTPHICCGASVLRSGAELGPVTHEAGVSLTKQAQLCVSWCQKCVCTAGAADT